MENELDSILNLLNASNLSHDALIEQLRLPEDDIYRHLNYLMDERCIEINTGFAPPVLRITSKGKKLLVNGGFVGLKKREDDLFTYTRETYNMTRIILWATIIGVLLTLFSVLYMTCH